MPDLRDRQIFEEAVAVSSGLSYLARAVDGMKALGRHHAETLRLERIAIQKRHARNMVRRIGMGQFFDLTWFRAESAQNDRTWRIAERYLRRYPISAL